ncbi:4'-phosphopantetheinyl transferase superfamily protein [Modestobacter lapidis]|nr:4'-phosphopantetheinyl transferase superfamily protein [Modestobacter lapidis]
MLRRPDGAPFIVTARAEDVLRTLDARLLTAVERRRCAALRHQADRDARAAAHLLVRWAATQLTGRPIETLDLVQRCPDCGAADHGRPSLPGAPAVHISLAYIRGAVVAGVGRHPVGVDIEAVRSADAGAAALSFALTGAEVCRVRSAPDPARMFLRLWTRKECLVKVGVLTLDTASQVELDPATEQPTAEGRTLSRHGPLHLLDWFDEALDAVVAAAGSASPFLASFPVPEPGRP